MSQMQEVMISLTFKNTNISESMVTTVIIERGTKKNVDEEVAL